MEVMLSKTNAACANSMARAYFEFLRDGMQHDENLMHVEADLGLSLLKLESAYIQDKYPFQYLNVGIQEANAVGVAAGLSAMGFVPFVHSFAPFISRRACDQVFISGAYSKANVKLIGSDPGVMAAYNGGTHMPFEDVAIMRAIPEMIIVEPSDTVIAKEVFKMAAAVEGMVYIRFTRKKAMQLYEEGSLFELGKANIIKEGSDVAIIASGIMLEEGLKAAELLRNDGISALLVDMFTIKPLDAEMVVSCAKKTGAVVTAENHSIIGGLGCAVSDVLMERCLVPLEKIGVRDRFGQVGDVDFLKREYQLTAQDIAAAAKKAISRK